MDSSISDFRPPGGERRRLFHCKPPSVWHATWAAWEGTSRHRVRSRDECRVGEGEGEECVSGRIKEVLPGSSVLSTTGIQDRPRGPSQGLSALWVHPKCWRTALGRACGGAGRGGACAERSPGVDCRIKFGNGGKPGLEGGVRSPPRMGEARSCVSSKAGPSPSSWHSSSQALCPAHRYFKQPAHSAAWTVGLGAQGCRRTCIFRAGRSRSKPLARTHLPVDEEILWVSPSAYHSAIESQVSCDAIASSSLCLNGDWL